MKVLYHLLNSLLPKFRFHYCCDQIRLTHCRFDDDLMILSVGGCGSLAFMQTVLRSFQGLSGIVANVDKSFMFLLACLVLRLKVFQRS